MQKKLNKSDWQRVIDECEKQMGIMIDTMKGMFLASKCQKVTHDLAVKERDSAPEAPKEEEKVVTPNK